ncbi:CCHC-type zinc finger protein [Robiginitalea biformata]|nr:hypothetical protein [Robiginitalea biformata]
MHLTGEGAKDYLEKLDNYENEAQRQLKEKLLKSNKSLISFLLRPADQVFSANGGSIQYNASDSQITRIKTEVSDVSEGLNIKDFLRKRVFKKYVADPNGLIMVDIDRDGMLQTSFYGTEQVYWYARRGNQVEAIIFEPFKSEDQNDDRQFFRVIDDKSDNIYAKNGDSIELLEDEMLPNYFGFVPAQVVGDIYDLNKPIFVSFLDEVLEDAKDRLHDVNTHLVHKLAHGYAKYWSYPENCTTCGGTGELKRNCADGDEQTTETYACYTCNGSGTKTRKDASDMMLLPIPREGENKLDPPAGYVNPSIEIWKQYKEDIKEIGDYMYECLWGSYFSRDPQAEKTATETFVNSQIKNARRKDLSKNFGRLHKFILDCYGKIALSSPSYESSVSYGTKYNDESPEVLLKTIIDATDKQISSAIIGDLQMKYYQAEYANDPIELTKRLKMLKTDPFPDLTAQEVRELGITGEELLMKIYHSQWALTLDNAKIMLMDVSELTDDLRQYVQQKQLSNELQ